MLGPFLLVSLLLVGVAFADGAYNVSHLIDESLESLKQTVILSGDITGKVARLRVAEWELSQARLADLSTLSRVSDCWMWSRGQTIIVNGSLTLDSMFLTAESAKGRVCKILLPLITVKENQIDFLLRMTVDTKGSCYSNYSVSRFEISGVALQPGEGVEEVNLDNLVKRSQDQIAVQIAPIFTRILQDYSGLCAHKFLNFLISEESPYLDEQNTIDSLNPEPTPTSSHQMSIDYE